MVSPSAFSLSTNANLRLHRAPAPLLEVQDYRRFDPTPDYDLPRTISGTVARRTLRDRSFTDRFGNQIRNQQSQTKALLAFADPTKAVTCIRRHQRREVLFAKKKAGMAARRMRPRRLTHQSKIGC